MAGTSVGRGTNLEGLTSRILEPALDPECKIDLRKLVNKNGLSSGMPRVTMGKRVTRIGQALDMYRTLMLYSTE